MTAKELIAFEDMVADLFVRKCIRYPIHLAGGNEEQLIGIFKEHVGPNDWVCGAWRMHYHCLLKGVPPNELLAAILNGKSISLCFHEYKVISSGIAGGIAPIAVGIAKAIKQKGEKRKAVCFIGDMTAEMGIVIESMKYGFNHELPILWVIEDNGKSVETDTMLAWGGITPLVHPKIIRYQYEMTRPHCGAGEWVQF